MAEFMSKKVLIAVIFVVFVFLGSYFLFFSSPQAKGGTVRLVIPLKEERSVDYAINSLYEVGAIKNKTTFRFALAFYGLSGKIRPGAYVMESGVNAFALASELKTRDEKWMVIPEGLRKEEIGEMFAESFSWSDEELEKWANEYTTVQNDYFEGVYFPDTYLMPVDDSPEKVAERMINRFNEKFAPYAEGFAKENIKWTTGLKIASLVQREAAGKNDMPLIAGILWNRLLSNMKLEVDATLQYARGDAGNGWWARVTKDDKKLDSPYNTYMYEGLPPYPIANPGIDAIEAVLYPEKTKCFFYLHDEDGQIHCAVTYEGHLENINKYLK
ncbi:MAG TPA: endolytic transglycosylase MltG [Candidatus Paceibacterota bacterium]|nr:endolytic transglycosylase MltG [Candidatus Paceibacterota bacterium]